MLRKSIILDPEKAPNPVNDSPEGSALKSVLLSCLPFCRRWQNAEKRNEYESYKRLLLQIPRAGSCNFFCEPFAGNERCVEKIT